MDVREVSAADTVRLRQLVLRNGRTDPLPGDGGNDGAAFHLGVYDDAVPPHEAVLLGTGNIRIDPAPWAPEVPAWRLRGMATAADARGRGVGALVLDGLVAHARANGGGILWCNARIPALTFYLRAGLVERGEGWDDPEIGPHVVMWRSL